MMKVQKALIQQALIAHEAQLEEEYREYQIKLISVSTNLQRNKSGGWVVRCVSMLHVMDGDIYEPSEYYATNVWFNDDLTIDEII